MPLNVDTARMSWFTGTCARPATVVSTGVPSLDDILGGGLPLTAPRPHRARPALARVCVVGSVPWRREDQDRLAVAADEAVSRPPSRPVFPPEDACRTFDLTARIPAGVVADALASGSLPSWTWIPRRAAPRPSMFSSDSRSPHWGDLTTQDTIALFARTPRAPAGARSRVRFVQLGSRTVRRFRGMVSEAGVGLGRGHHDGCVHSQPGTGHGIPSAHGLVRIHTLLLRRAWCPRVDRFSTLRGAVAGSGENNLGFKCTRKRLAFETLHLDIDGGVGERRTTCAISSGDSTASDGARQ
ncbi:hypothetical protein FB451DRAFT_1512112 [Mycena latifolia]|nr:hypothetical protein FB451DRAFT_1512112 [Mycena latifolia]